MGEDPKQKRSNYKKIVEYIIKKEIMLKKKNSDNIYLAIGNWLVLGEQTGFRRKE